MVLDAITCIRLQGLSKRGKKKILDNYLEREKRRQTQQERPYLDTRKRAQTTAEGVNCLCRDRGKGKQIRLR